MSAWCRRHHRLGSCNVIFEDSCEFPEQSTPLQAFFGKARAALRWLCRDQEDDSSVSKPRAPTFEEQAAWNASKFEICFLLIETTFGLIYLAGNQGRPWPVDDVNLWPGGVISVAVRCSATMLKLWLKLPPRWLQAVLFLIDGVIFCSCHPNVSHYFWFSADMPTRPSEMGFELNLNDILHLSSNSAAQFVERKNQDFSTCLSNFNNFEAEVANIQLMVQEETTMVTYYLNILVWYNSIFILSSRQTLFLVPLVLVFYIITNTFTWTAYYEVAGKPKSCLKGALFFFSCVVAVACKSKLEKAQRLEYKLSEQKSQEVIKERVLRYEAEFAKERVGGAASLMWGNNHEQRSRYSPSVAETQITTSTICPSVAASLRSAPAALHTGAVMKQARRSGECLPHDAVVWVEGHALPRPVCTVKVGDRVLCHDNLSLVPKYVDVMASDMMFGEASWVQVKLADGTSLTLTSDHPTQPRRALQEVPQSGHIAAGDLRPGSDSLMVLKMQPEKVRSVAPTREQSGGRVALSLQQPERHELFVAPPSCGKPGQEMATIAVGSADMATPANQQQGGGAGCSKGKDSCAAPPRAFGLTVKRTFIDFETEDDSRSRCSSCPPRLTCVRPAPARPGVTWAPNVTLDQKRSTSPPARMLRRVGSESDVTSVSSRQSSTPTDIDVLVAVTNCNTAAAAVGEMLQVRRAGFASRGSCGHEQGTCTPCIFHNRYQHGLGPPCFKGALCDRCHEPHAPIGRKKRVPGAVRSQRRLEAAMRASAAGEGEEEEEM
mmetsp:Transcript_2973/g.6536  ORF Transcript_2973/g.6536 Transcript_2973/m.6536 type:complete len:775 (-) Transcript_2973:200-2524(-)|eukprot:CAMPEP_0178393390 /NCGR_PEP_ID=MMETSP0689_2-20121128/12161_1 /TAXON_ID=160604 /ORGANISM="Amphidinium massartii, Strain CS-259" /LENGTH=774 /DNA_ID=CAMNT_0020013977 /DNA_START=50 /DNA_END=2374 /DNA_ORIENTATION=+